MTDEERRFKVLKVEKYENAEKNENWRLASSIVMTAGFALGATVMSLSGHSIGHSLVEAISIGGVASSIVVSGASMIHSICRKTLLESKIEDIKLELENAEKEEQRGRSL